MLPGVLLDVIAPPQHVYRAVQRRPLFKWRRTLDKVNDSAVIQIRYFANVDLRPSGRRESTDIVHLSPAGRIKRSAIQNNAGARLVL